MRTTWSSVFLAALLCVAVAHAAPSPAATREVPAPVPVRPDAPTLMSLPLGAAEHLTCATCTDLAKIAFNLTAGEKGIIEDILNYECKKALPLPNETKLEALCEAVGKDLLAVLPWINKELGSLAWNVPLGFCSVFVPVCKSNCCEAGAPPEEVHLSLTHEASEMAVTWTTLDETATSTVQWGKEGAALSNSAAGTTRTFTDGGWVGTLHTAVMTGLVPGQAYTYRVGDATAGWSQDFTFSTFPANIGTKERPLHFVQIGDTGFGDTSNQTIATITSLVESGEVDLLLHVGDIGYADGYMTHWDLFLNKVQPIASRIPYMTTPGNHELWFDFEAYKFRFYMPTPVPGADRPPAQDTDMYYSFNVGPVHFVMTDTETWYDTANMDKAQLAWLKADLATANKQRADVPWMVAAGHRPLYCSNGGVQCGLFAEWLRYLAEDIYRDAHVDLVIQCHEHSMERSLPMYKGNVTSNNYTNPSDPVYIVNGAGGNREGNANPHPAPWVQFHSGDVGFGYATVTPGSFNYQFRHAAGSVLDQFTMTKPPVADKQ